MKGRQGFSLIEILIATSILLVIVVMVSMVFQQQSAAFIGCIVWNSDCDTLRRNGCCCEHQNCG